MRDFVKVSTSLQKECLSFNNMYRVPQVNGNNQKKTCLWEIHRNSFSMVDISTTWLLEYLPAFCFCGFIFPIFLGLPLDISCHPLLVVPKPHYKSYIKDKGGGLHLVLGNVDLPEEVFTERDSRRAQEIRLVQRMGTSGELQINPLLQMLSCLTKTHCLSVGKPLS